MSRDKNDPRHERIAMTVGWAPSTFSAGAVLFPRGDPRETLWRDLDHHGVTNEVLRTVKHLSNAGRLELRRQFAGMIAGMLDLDVANLIIRTLQTYDELVAAGERTTAAPTSVEIVQLLAVPIPWATYADVQLRVDEVPRLTIRFTLNVVLEISAEAVVENGRLVAVRSGQCTVTVTLNANEIPLTTNVATLDLAMRLPLGSGIPLTRVYRSPGSCGSGRTRSPNVSSKHVR
jgi:hypothetical protein